jgi:hypothetical protein
MSTIYKFPSGEAAFYTDTSADGCETIYECGTGRPVYWIGGGVAHPHDNRRDKPLWVRGNSLHAGNGAPLYSFADEGEVE